MLRYEDGGLQNIMTAIRVPILQELYKALLECSERGLIVSSKWAAEQFFSFAKGEENGELTEQILSSSSGK